jgi:hypothetical protein
MTVYSVNKGARLGIAFPLSLLARASAVIE